MLPKRIILFKMSDIAIQLFVSHQVFVGHQVFSVAHKQQAKHLIHFTVTPQEILFVEILAHGSEEVMLVDGALTLHQFLSTFCPFPIEKSLLQLTQILAGHLVFAVNQVAFGQSLGQARTLAIVRYGLLRLVEIAHGIVHHAQAQINLTDRNRRGEVPLELGQQTLHTVLVELKQAVAHLSGLLECQVQAGHTGRSGRILLLSLGYHLLPLLGAHHEIVI